MAVVESFDCISFIVLEFFSLTFQVAKLLGTNVGTIQQDLSILLKDESIEVSKRVIFSIPKRVCIYLSNYTQFSTEKQKTFSVFL